jgi:antitoxin ParD1/3/4
MASESINVKVTGELRTHVERQTGPGGYYESASEYVRDLIRRDKRREEDGLAWLKAHLAPLVETPEEQFIEADAEEVIRRAKTRYLKTGAT